MGILESEHDTNLLHNPHKLAMFLASIIPLLFMTTNVKAHPGHKLILVTLAPFIYSTEFSSGTDASPPPPPPPSPSPPPIAEFSFGYELIMRPAWASAVARTVMGWNPTAGTKQLSSKLPYDTTWTSITNLCDEIGGDTFGSGNVYCAVKTPWTQLFDAGGSMSATCATLGGKSFGHINQFCAVEGVWSQLRAPSPVCSILGGTLFGSGGGSVCAVRGIVSQLTTKLPGDTSWQGEMTETCSKIGGHAFSSYCAVEGAWTQLTTKLPGDTSWQGEMTETCSKIGGHAFSSSCAVNTAPPASNTNVDGGLGGGAVAGIVIGSITGVALLCLAAWLVLRKLASPADSCGEA